MSDVNPTRSAVIEMKDERRAMHEGYVFLDEKCLLLAGEILRELERHAPAAARVPRAARRRAGARCRRRWRATGCRACRSIRPPIWRRRSVRERTRSLMGVRLQEAELDMARAPAAEAVMPLARSRSLPPRFCRRAGRGAPLAAVSGNLERLSLEYRRAVRRARALQDVMLPELDHSIYDIESRLEELEQEDAIWMRQGAGG